MPSCANGNCAKGDFDMANGTLELTKFEGKTISDFCDVGYVDAATNHCAHWVSHVMGYQFGATCKTMMHPKKAGATPGSIRVHEVFARCPEVGVWADKPAAVTTCLAFVTAKGNVNLKQKTMSNVPKKHVGIFDGTFVWHYSNTKDQVVKVTPADFQKHYAGKDITVFYGKFPE